MDKKTLNALIDEYIRENYIPDDDIQEDGGIRSFFYSILGDVAGKLEGKEGYDRGIKYLKSNSEGPRRKKITSAVPDLTYLDNRLSFAIDKKLADKGETFSEMLSRFIKESGKKNSEIYNLANVKRQFFSKIMNNADYQPSKQVVLAFALALRLEFEKTRELLASAGYILSRAKKFDLIIAACLENKFYDVDRINEILDERELPLLGSRPEKENKNDDEN